MGIYVVTLFFLLITIFMVWFLVSHDRGPKEPVGALWAAFFFGFIATIIVSFAYMLYRPLLEESNLVRLLFSMTYVGAIEEVAKFLPLALYIYRKKYFNEHSDGVIYFAIAGLSFGLLENLSYTFIFGTGTGILRMILLPIFHGATAAIGGYYLAKMKLGDIKMGKLIFAVTLLSLIHGLYNFGLGSGQPHLLVFSLMITLLLFLGFFLYFMRARELDQEIGLATKGKNSYCRHCGRPNPHRTFHCEYCGNLS